MEANKVRLNAKTGKPVVSSRGGARKNAGRPKGSSEKVTVKHLLETLYQKTGQSYEEILMEDFLQARMNNDGHLVNKYHNLLGNKLFSTLNTIEVTDSQESVDAKKAAFADALAAMTGIINDKK